MIKNIAAGSGLSASAGYEFAGERLKKHFGDYGKVPHNARSQYILPD